MFKSLLGIVEDTVKIVVAPVEIVADLTRVVTKPVADVAQAAAEEVKEATKEITGD
jgi:hypothetical protein